MSYKIVVEAAGGELTVTSSGDVPDGQHVIHLLDEGTHINVSVDRRDTDGMQVLLASAAHVKGS
jgi:hypothetical protein